MKLLITATAAALISTVAFAGQSDRYNDIRLDTSNNADQVFSEGANPTDFDRAQRGRDQISPRGKRPSISYSSRSNIGSAEEGYIYGGYGPGNDSR